MCFILQLSYLTVWSKQNKVVNSRRNCIIPDADNTILDALQRNLHKVYSNASFSKRTHAKLNYTNYSSNHNCRTIRLLCDWIINFCSVPNSLLKLTEFYKIINTISLKYSLNICSNHRYSILKGAPTIPFLHLLNTE